MCKERSSLTIFGMTSYIGIDLTSLILDLLREANSSLPSRQSKSEGSSVSLSKFSSQDSLLKWLMISFKTSTKRFLKLYSWLKEQLVLDINFSTKLFTELRSSWTKRSVPLVSLMTMPWSLKSVLSFFTTHLISWRRMLWGKKTFWMSWAKNLASKCWRLLGRIISTKFRILYMSIGKRRPKSSRIESITLTSRHTM